MAATEVTFRVRDWAERTVTAVAVGTLLSGMVRAHSLVWLDGTVLLSAGL
jgi:hypothetical protein